MRRAIVAVFTLVCTAAPASLVAVPARAGSGGAVHGHHRHEQKAVHGRRRGRDKQSHFRASKVRVDLSDHTFGSTPPILAEAARFLGDHNPTHFIGPWCGVFLGMVARAVHIKPPAGYPLAINWLNAGPHVRDPRPGDLAVFRHHVTIVAAIRGREIVGLGGNQSHRVRYSEYDLRRVIAFVRI